MSVFTPIRIDIAGQPCPYFLYSRNEVGPGVTRVPVSFKIDSGYAYLCRRAILTWPQIAAVATGGYAPTLSIEFLDRAKNKPRQMEPVPQSLVSTPAGWQTATFAAPAPVDPTGLGQNYSASVRPSHKIFNYFYAYADTIEMEVIGFGDVSVFGWRPQFFDILLEGYNISERHLSLWGRGGRA